MDRSSKQSKRDKEYNDLHDVCNHECLVDELSDRKRH